MKIENLLDMDTICRCTAQSFFVFATAALLAGCGGGSPSSPSGAPPVVVNECAPLIPKAGDSLTHATTASFMGINYSQDLKFDYVSDTYLGKPALRAHLSDPSSMQSLGDAFLDPTTGGLVGYPEVPNATLVTAYTPIDYRLKLFSTPLGIGDAATQKVSVRISGRDFTDAVPTYIGATAMVVELSMKVSRSANETIKVAAGTFANACKLSIETTVTNISIESGTTVSQYPPNAWASLVGGFVPTDKKTVWLTNKMVEPIETFSESDGGPSVGVVTVTEELKSFSLVPR